MSSGHEEYWKVAVEAPLPSSLTYRVSDEMRAERTLERGLSVMVPLGKRRVAGVLLGPGTNEGTFKLKDIDSVVGDRPRLPESFMNWIEWLASYYIHPVGQVSEMAFPPLEKTVKERKSKKAPVTPTLEASTPPQLTAEQATVISAIRSQPGFAAHLVHGVTGSGKTEIYMSLLEDVVARGQQGIVLVPEISLTPQLIERFVRRLGDAVAVIHSHLTPREKTNQWWAMLEGKKKILIGARSALFCPLPNLGMIVVDEEHESSFKQDEKLKYHARDAAVMLAKFSNCPVILGSATPSLETWQNAQLGRYKLHQLKARVADRALPTIEVVDLRSERDDRRIAGNSDLPFWCGEKLFTAIEETLDKKQQVALFLNRRGVAQAVVCPDCGWVPACPNCEVKLTLHGKSHLLCHYCDYHETMSEYCTECKVGEPKPMGLGTELIEKDLGKLFPNARIIRMDRDEINTREDLERAVKSVENREVDILVGTQMIAKGLDFPGLTLVGLVLADVAFNLPDFRSAERSFQLLTQVAGRSGRHLDEGAGRVIVQTYNPDHPSLTFTQAHDFEGFAGFELSFREALKYPPFARLAGFRIQGLDLDKVTHTARKLRARAEQLRTHSEGFATIEILGPAQAPLAKIRNQHRWQLLLKGPDARALGTFCRRLLDNQEWVPSGVKVAVDIDAVHLL
ncbi:MAG TPA: primosomal protein N' [Bdellovibrionales bacterium]|nr:primosomal protein N' [Bdellovibrionales bacterium]